jgi:two-component system chemotaxis response regulator CheY
MALRRNLRILVVDDMSVSRHVLQQMLEALGINQVRVASSAAQALETLKQVPIDLVFADINMPGINGVEFLKRLRSEEKTCRIRFVLISGDDTSDAIAEAWRLGIDKFLPKPFNINSLTNCVEAISGRI